MFLKLSNIFCSNHHGSHAEEKKKGKSMFVTSQVSWDSDPQLLTPHCSLLDLGTFAEVPAGY